MSRLIDKLLACLPSVRESFYASGFELPRQYLAAIEATRQRGADEYDYEGYLDETLREYAALPSSWRPSARHLLKTEERSAYLDLLASRFGSEAMSLDPSYKLFAKLENDAWLDLLHRFRAQKQKEVDRHAIDLGKAVGPALTESIVQIAEMYGYYPRRPVKAKDEALNLDCRDKQTLRTSLKLVDLNALKKRGDVVVQYFFDELPNKPFGLSSFLPGDGQYSNWNKTPQAVLFSFYVQCRFAAELSAGAA